MNLGFSLPTGSIDEKGRTPKDANVDTQLPYTMQLGSGTYDIKPSIVYSGVAGDWTYGANLNMTLRTGKNDRDYRLGNVYQAGIWTRYALTDWIQPSFRIDGVVWDEISGEDDTILPQGGFTCHRPLPSSSGATEIFRRHEVLGAGWVALKRPSGPT